MPLSIVQFNGSQPVLLKDDNGTSPVGIIGDTGTPSVVLVGGKDGFGVLRPLTLTTAGKLVIDGSGYTQPISAVSLPLPSGAATEATLATLLTNATFISRINTLGQKIMAGSTPVVIASDQSAIPISGTITANIGTTGGLALDATVASLQVMQSSTTSGQYGTLIQGAVSTTNPSYIDGNTNPLSLTLAGALRTDGSDVTQPISAINLPLPSGASTSAKQPNFGIAGSPSADVLTVQGDPSGTPIPVTLGMTSIEIGTVDQGNPNTLANAWPIKVTNGLDLVAVKAASTAALAADPSFVTAFSPNSPLPAGSNVIGAITQSGTWDINNISGIISLPTGASTSANQTTLGAQTTKINDGTNTATVTASNALKVDGSNVTQPTSSTQLPASLVGGRLDTNIGSWLGSTTPTVGQKTMAASLPVTFASDQSTLTIAGTVAVTQSTSPWVDNISQWGGAATSLGQKVSASSVPVVLASDQSTLNTNASQSGNWSVRLQDGSGNLITSQTNSAQRALDIGINVSGVQIDPRSIRALTASDVVTAQQGTSPWVENLTQVGGSSLTLGQKTMAASIPVVLASDQSASLDVGVADKGAFTYGTSIEQPIGGVYQDTSPSLTAGTTGAVRVTQNRAFHINLRNDSGTEIGTSSNPIRIDTTGTTTQPISSTQLPAALVSGRLDSNIGAWLGSTVPTVGSKVSANSIPVVVASDQGAIPVTQSGTWNINNIVGTISLPTGAATASNQTTVGSQTTKINDGTNTASVTAANALKVDGSSVTQPISGTITANIGTTNGLALDATLAKLTISQGTALGSNTQALMGGSVTTAAPTYTTGQINPLSLNTSGALRVDGSGATQPISGTVTANQGGAPWSSNITQIGGSALTLGQKVSASSIPIVIASDQSDIGVTQSTSPWIVAGNKTNNNAVPGATNLGALSALANASAPTWIEGNLVLLSVDLSGGLRVGTHAVTQSGTWTVAQGAAAALSTAWPVKVTDGTNTMPTMDAVGRAGFHKVTDGTNTAAVKAASTAAVATDPALVVALSPNSGTISVSNTPANATSGLVYGDIALSAIVSNTAIRRTTYTEQSSNFTGSIVSSSASDASAGTGARTVRIYWMDSTGASVGTEDVTLNGTTNVNLVTSTKCFIQKMEVRTVGSGGSNAGTITLHAGLAGAGATIGTIATGDNQTFWAHHYVQSGLTCTVTGLAITINGGGGLFFLKYLPIGVTNSVEFLLTDIIRESAQAPSTPRALTSPIKVTGPARIIMYVTTEAGTSLTYRGAFDFYEV